MVPRLGLASIALAVLTYVFAAGAQESAPNVDGSKVKEEVSLKERQIAAKFQEFEQLVLRLKQRLALSPVQADRDQAAVLDRVLEACKDRSISVKFEQILEDLKSKKLDTTTEIGSALNRVRTVADDLRDIVAMLREDTRGKANRDRQKELEAMIKDLEKIIRNQQSVQGLTQNGNTQKEELNQNQKAVTKKTGEILTKLDGKADEKNPKGAEKAPGKNGDKAAQAKDDGDKSGDKAGDKSKDPAQAKAGGDSKDPKADAKAGDGSENKKDGKDGGSPAQAKGGDDKKDGGEAKSGKSPDGAQAKDGGKKAGDPKAGDPKAGDPKSGKSGDPAQAKDGGKKAGDPKSGAGQAKSGKPSEGAQAKSGKPSEGSGEAKPGEGKPGSPSSGKGQAKAGPSSKGQGEAKGDGSASPMPPSSSPPQASNKSGPPPGKSPPPGGPKDDVKIAKKQIQEGQEKQQQAEENIEKGKNEQASGDQNDAIKKLEEAKKELERLLRQLREEEVERILAQLQQRCEKMLAMQQLVLAGTERVDKSITSNADKTPTRENKQDSLKLSDNEGDIVVEATRAIEILEAEGSAIAFPEVFQQVREDMKHVQRRLGVTDTGEVTHRIEVDIIDTLKEMIEALKKKRQENQAKPGESGPPPPPQDQKLLDKIAELKMIRSMQVRINGRTETYGKMYTGEQTAEPGIRRELHGLSDRQERLFEVTNRMARGDNK